jgi:hypothetical protein
VLQRDYMSFEDQQKWAQGQANRDRRNEAINKLREVAQPARWREGDDAAEDFAAAK